MGAGCSSVMRVLRSFVAGRTLTGFYSPGHLHTGSGASRMVKGSSPLVWYAGARRRAPVMVSELEGSDEWVPGRECPGEWSRGAIAPRRVQGQSPGRWSSGARIALERCRRGRASGRVHGCQTLVWLGCNGKGEATFPCQAKPRFRGARGNTANGLQALVSGTRCIILP